MRFITIIKITRISKMHLVYSSCWLPLIACQLIMSMAKRLVTMPLMAVEAPTELLV